MKRCNFSSIIIKKMLILSTVILFTFSLNAQDWVEVVAFQPPQTLQSIRFANDSVGYTVSALYGGSTYNIHKTTDGGNTWTDQSSGYSGFRFNDIWAFSEDTIMMCGLQGVVIHTTDGGENWIADTVAPDIQLGGISFVGETGYVCGDMGTVYKTENMGNNWTLIPTPNNAVLHDIDFLSEDFGFICGSNCIYYTGDGGQTWQEPLSFPHPNVNWWLRSLAIVNENIVFVCGDAGEIYKTINGGKDWQLLENIPTQESIQSIVALDENNIYACGFEGTVMQSPDGGENWELMSASSQEHFNSIHFTPEGNGFLCTWQGEVLRYLNPTIGIVEPLIDNNTCLYPNPAADLVNISSDYPMQSLNVYNFAGQVVLTETINNTTYRVNTSKLDAGIYLFQIETNEGRIAKRIIIE